MPGEGSTVSSVRVFATALFQGVLWGLAGIAALAAVAMIFIAVARSDADLATVTRSTLETTAWTAMIASILALFPVGPMAGIIAWQLYRRGVVSPLAYAAVGMLCALAAPVLVAKLLLDSMRYPSTDNDFMSDGTAYLVLAGIAIAGAFAGFMAGRAIRRSQTAP